MLSREEYIRKSLELNLFFARIMREHAIFMEASFTAKDAAMAKEADMYKTQFSMLLGETLSLSNGFVSREAVTSGEFYTKDTIKAEMATQYLTGISIDMNVTNVEMAMVGDKYPGFVPMMEERVGALNQKGIYLANGILQFKNKILENVLTCRLFTSNYPSMIDHLIRETRYYISKLISLQNREEPGIVKEAQMETAFWNEILGDHAKYIRGMLDPEERKLFETALRFGKDFDQLTAQAKFTAKNPRLIPRTVVESLECSEKLRDFKSTATEDLVACKLKSVILPLLGDHVLREANHYIRILRTLKRKI